MSCSIDDSSSNTTQLDKQQQQLNQSNQNPSQTPQSSNLILTPIQLQTSNSYASNMTINNNIHKSNSNSNQLNCLQNQTTSNSQSTQQLPAKIVHTGGPYIITTLFQSQSQKLVTVSANQASNNSNHNSQPGQTISIMNQASSSSVGSSSGSNGSSNSNGTSSPMTQQNEQPTTTTVTLTSPNPQALMQSTSSSSSSNNNNNTAILYPLQTHNQTQQYTNFVDSNSNQNQTQNQSNVNSLFSPINSNSNQYYTFHSTQNFGQQQQPSIITNQQSATNQTVSPNRLNNTVLLQDHAQQQQQHQQVYTMFDASQTLEMDNVTIDFDSPSTHTAQAAPITVQWLIDNFEPAEGCSLRRSTLYNYYIHHCNEQKIEPVNPASFGKLIRSVFLGLRTRRLGTRGNSKYHYYGIRVKINSPLNQLSEDHTLAIRNHPMSLSPTGSPQSHQPQSPIHTHHQHHHSHPNKRAKTNNNFDNNNIPQSAEYKPVINHGVNEQHQQTGLVQQVNNQANQISQAPPLMTVVLTSNTNSNIIPKTVPQTTQIAKSNKNQNNHINQNLHQNQNQNDLQKNQYIQESNINPNPNSNPNPNPSPHQNQHQHQQQDSLLLKAANTEEDPNQVSLSESTHIPNFGHVNTDNIDLPSSCTLNDVKKFEDLYKHHCRKILDAVIGLKLENIKEIWFLFWRCVPEPFYQEQLSDSKFFALCELNQIIDFVKNCDYLFYQFCIEILIPDVLGLLPHNLVQNIRTLSKSVQNWMGQALVNVPDRLKQAKQVIISTFSMTLRRYTSLNHLAQTVKNSLQHQQILAQMLIDINKVDFNYIREQAKWTCGCDERVVSRLEHEFKESLRNHAEWSLEGWVAWLDSSASGILQEYEGTDGFAKMARQFLLKWSYMCSSIVRDLTLRSAPTFGSFHLIRLLYDEYMYYWIEHKIANEYKQPPLAIMSNFEIRSLFSSSSLINSVVSGSGVCVGGGGGMSSSSAASSSSSSTNL